MICVDLENGTFKENQEISKEVSSTLLVWQMVEQHSPLEIVPAVAGADDDDVSFIESQARAGYASKDVSMIVESMAKKASSRRGRWVTTLRFRSSLRDRACSTTTSNKDLPKLLTAIDPLRGVWYVFGDYLGAKGNLLDVSSDYARVSLSSPFLFDSDLTVIQNHPHLKTATIKAIHQRRRWFEGWFGQVVPRTPKPSKKVLSASSSPISLTRVRILQRFRRFWLLVRFTTT